MKSNIEEPQTEEQTLTTEEIEELERRVRLDRELETGEIVIFDPEICM